MLSTGPGAALTAPSGPIELLHSTMAAGSVPAVSGSSRRSDKDNVDGFMSLKFEDSALPKFEEGKGDDEGGAEGESLLIPKSTCPSRQPTLTWHSFTFLPCSVAASGGFSAGMIASAAAEMNLGGN